MEKISCSLLLVLFFIVILGKIPLFAVCDSYSHDVHHKDAKIACDENKKENKIGSCCQEKNVNKATHPLAVKTKAQGKKKISQNQVEKKSQSDK